MRVLHILAVLVLIVAACSGDTTESSQGTTEVPSTGSEGTSPEVTETPEGSVAPSGSACWAADPATGESAIAFSDQTEGSGLVEPLTGMHGHAAVWADLQDDGQVDLIVGTFADRETDAYQLRGATGPSPDRVLVQTDGSFGVLGGLPDMFTRTSGGASADLDNDGDLDVVVSRNWDDDNPDAPATQILRNDLGGLTPVDVSGLPSEFGGRSVAFLDYDRDGLLDIVITEDRWSGSRTVLLHNLGDLAFEDVTTSVGIPSGVDGLGVAVADLNNDGHQDILVTGSNRLFVADGSGSFVEADNSALRWQVFDDEDDVAGVSVADVNRDGYLDVLIGQHYNSTVDDGNQVPVRLYLNRGPDGSGFPVFEDVTEDAGLVGLPTKAPHVEINDLDNDGWPELITTASAADGSAPAIFRHLGLEGDVPRFEAPQGLGSQQYWIAGPTADVDRDGRLDMLLVEWEPSLPSLLLRNETQSGNWLEISVDAANGFGIGWRADVYPAGSIGDAGALLGSRQITTTQGYSSGVAPVAHFGLGEESGVDVVLTEPGGEVHEFSGLEANQHVRLPDGC